MELFCDLAPRAFPGLLVHGTPPDRGAVARLLARVADFAENADSIEAERVRPLTTQFIECNEFRAVYGREHDASAGELEQLQLAFLGWVALFREALRG